MLQNTDTVWLAAWLEGEGWFGLSKGSIAIQAVSTDRDVIEKVARLLNAPSVREKKPTKFTRRQAYVCRVTGNKAEEVMRAIRPFMGKRRGQRIDELLQHRTDGPKRRTAAGIRRWANPDFKQRTSAAISAAKLGKPETRAAALRGWESRRKRAQATPEVIKETQPVNTAV